MAARSCIRPALLTLAGLWLILTGTPLLAATTTIAVAANFTDATGDLIALFERQTQHRVKASFGSTGKLYAQIAHGAPFDVFLAADRARPQKAEVDGLAVQGSRFTYAQGQLVLWSPHAETFDDGEAFLKAMAYRRIAMANPRTAPYGQAAQEVMQHLGVWPQVQGKLVRGDSIAQAFQFVATANTDAGFVAASQIRAWSQPGSLWQVPAAYYTPIAQQAVLLQHGADNPAARAFLSFLRSPEARGIIASHGYRLE
ncbi:MAG: molybdate ABC transporter substrate-binding protein [Gammaproteobacteria bacterium]|nr:molybdate ABC transporter substrate-binding protein [Gammaproteobacteria bacterium]